MDYSYIIIPLIVLISSQALKLATDGIRGNFDLKNIFISYGGMPSSHTAFAVSITTLIGLRVSFTAPIFAMSLVFTLLIMRDASTFRRLLGQQAKVFNRFINGLPPEQRKDLPLFRERMGHSLMEVIVGAVWGVGLTFLLNLL